MKEDDSLPPGLAPWHLRLVGILGLLWNAVGAFDNLMVLSGNESYLARFNPEQLDAFSRFPGWLVAFWAVAVWGGLLGALLLLMGRRLAVPVLLASLVAMVVTALHNQLGANGLYATGGTGPAFVLLIFSIALGLWLYAWAMRRRRVLV